VLVAITAARRLMTVYQVGAVAVLASCGPAESSAPVPRPCQFLTRAVAVQITGDAHMAIQAADVTEAVSGYEACVFADTANEANTVAVQIKRVSGDISGSTLRSAAAFFSKGEPVAPFRSFSVTGVGDQSLGEATPGVAFVVFSKADLLVYVGAGSTSAGADVLRSGIENLARSVAAAVWIPDGTVRAPGREVRLPASPGCACTRSSTCWTTLRRRRWSARCPTSKDTCHRPIQKSMRL